MGLGSLWTKLAAKFQALQAVNRWALGLGALVVVIWVGSLFLPAPQRSEEVSLPLVAVDILLKLGVVLLLIYASAYALRRWGMPGAMASGRARQLYLREMLALSPRRALYLVQAGERLLLIGATDHTLNLIAELNAQPGAGGPPAAGPQDAPQISIDMITGVK